MLGVTYLKKLANMDDQEEKVNKNLKASAKGDLINWRAPPGPLRSRPEKRNQKEAATTEEWVE